MVNQVVKNLRAMLVVRPWLLWTYLSIGFGFLAVDFMATHHHQFHYQPSPPTTMPTTTDIPAAHF